MSEIFVPTPGGGNPDDDDWDDEEYDEETFDDDGFAEMIVRVEITDD